MIIEDTLDLFLVDVSGSNAFELVINRKCDSGVLPVSREELKALRDVCDKALNVSEDELNA